MTPAKVCKNGLATDVTFNSFTPSSVTPLPSVGQSTDASIWIDGKANADFGVYTPAVQFNEGGNAS
jgi:hypothetical protein